MRSTIVPPVLPGEQPVEQSGARVANVKVSSRRRSKTYADGGRNAHITMLTNAEGIKTKCPAASVGERLFVRCR